MELHGAHAVGYNEYVGICLIGQGDFTVEQYESLVVLLKNLNSKDIVGHNQVSDKTCPLFDVPMFLDKYGIEFNDFAR